MASKDRSKQKKKQEEYREEDMMARGPVSRGASNKSAPMYTNQQPASPPPDQSRQGNPPDYDKMIRSQTSSPEQGSGMATDRAIATPGGATLPTPGLEGTDNPRGGRNTSNSTVGAGGSSGGTVVGTGATTDRGRMTNPDMSQTTNTETELNEESRPGKQKRKVRGEITPPLTPNT